MRISKRRVVGLMIASLAFVGCAPNASPTNESIQSQPQALETNLWSPVASMLTERKAHSSLRLDDGRVLVAGGSTDPADGAELYDANENAWTQLTVPVSIFITSQDLTCRPAMAQSTSGTVVIVTGTMVATWNPSSDKWTTDVLNFPLPTCHPQAVAIKDDNVMILVDNSVNTDVSAFMYEAGQVKPFANLPVLAQGNWHGLAAVALGLGEVLVTGGEKNSETAIYDPSVPNTWSLAGSMYYPRIYHGLGLLPEGKVLAVGGHGDSSIGAYGDDSAEILDIMTGEWTPTTSMLQPRNLMSTVTTLDSGQILVVGGSISSTAEFYDASTQSWTAIESSEDKRYFGHASAQLEDGRVLVTGGDFASGTPEAAVCDALAIAWEKRAPFSSSGRVNHSATALDDGTMLVFGGEEVAAGATSSFLQETWMYDPQLDAWSQKAPSLAIHEYHTATKLSDGRVFVAGGTQTPFAEIFDSQANAWTAVESSTYSSSEGLSATLLKDGRVLLLGGTDQSVLFFDPTTNTWTTGPSLPDDAVIGLGHSATLLETDTTESQVLVTGGFTSCPVGLMNAMATTAAFVFDTETNSWQSVGSLNQARGYHSATRLSDGRVLVAGGGGDIAAGCTPHTWASVFASAEIYDPSTKQWSSAGSMKEPRTDHRAILLDSDKVLVVGGRANSEDRVLTTSEVYDPLKKLWTTTSRLQRGRYGHTLTALEGGIFAVGGAHRFTANLTTVERFAQSAKGDSCTADEQCISGYCASGVCCDTNCNSRCLSCSSKKLAAGQEKVLPDGTCEDVSGCETYACQAETGTCGTSCVSVDDCVSGYVCDTSSVCTEPTPNASAIDEASCAAGPTESSTSSWASFAIIASAYALRRRKSQRKS